MGKDDLQNDFSILKSIKLLFFVSAAKAKRPYHSILIDDTFEFVAMPYGHVESDIYDYIRQNNGKLNFYTLDNRRAILVDSIGINELNENIDPSLKEEIDLSIQYLKKQNPKLVLLSPFDLVDLSHAWYSWQHFFKDKDPGSRNSYAISPETIKKEDKIFSLQTFR